MHECEMNTEPKRLAVMSEFSHKSAIDGSLRLRESCNGLQKHRLDKLHIYVGCQTAIVNQNAAKREREREPIYPSTVKQTKNVPRNFQLLQPNRLQLTLTRQI